MPAVSGKINFHSQSIFEKIQKCRTPELGGHMYVCEDCGSLHVLNNSCGNRNCPVCQGNKRKRWIERQCDSLVNVPYFHVVFTVPDLLNGLFLKHQKECYNLLFHSAWDTLRVFFENDRALAGRGGMLCILHTWGQTLSFHPHIHCLVPAAGISSKGEFKLVRGKDKFLFNVKNMSRVFRAKFAAGLTLLQKKEEISLSGITRGLMFKKQWVVYAQRPFSVPENVVRYIGMYSHRVAISENRIIGDTDGVISFYYKDYRDDAKRKIMQLPGEEFLRRFALHILPHRLVKIRYFGQLNNRMKKHFLLAAKETVGLYRVENEEAGCEKSEFDFDLDLDDEPIRRKNTPVCPHCKSLNMTKIAHFGCLHNFKELVSFDLGGKKVVYNSRDGPQVGNLLMTVSGKSL